MTLDLIGAFNWYLALAFVVGTALRARNTLALAGMVYRSAGRWPKLRALVATHRAIFLRWPTVVPLAVTLALALANAFAVRFVWPDARITPGDLLAYPAALAGATVVVGVMGFLDFRAVFLFARLDRPKVEGVLDQAEHWLGSWKAHAVLAATLGLINPRRIVGERVRVALVDGCLAANGQLWATSLQVVARIAFGLTLWVVWAVALR